MRFWKQAALAVLMIVLAAPLQADDGDERAIPFERDHFETLLAEGKPVLVDIWASWCPTCRRQGRVLTELMAEEKFSEVVWLKVDYDEQKDMVEFFEAPRQSVLIMFADGVERARSVAETDAGRIRELVAAGLE